MTTVVTEEILRTNFPEFASKADYPDPVVTFWINVADMMISPTRWGRMRDLGVQLFACHNLNIEGAARRAAANGGIPGANTGPIASKSVGPASISYDTAASIAADATHWNLTVYGTRFIQMARMFGAGPLIVGVGCAPPFTLGAWPGPAPWPLPSGTGFSS